MVGAVLGLIGFILITVALVTPWYFSKVSESGGPFSGAYEQQNYYLGDGSNSIQPTCGGLPSGASCGNSTSYTSSPPDYNNTGHLSEALQGLVIGGLILGLLGFIFAFMARKNQKMVRWAMIFLVLAMLLAIVAPIAQLAAQPGAIHSDISNNKGSTSSDGPWNTYFGSNSSSQTFGGTTVTTDESWGANTGWYLSIGAFVVFLVAAILLMRSRKGDMMPPPPTDMPAAGSMDASGAMMPPPPPPPPSS